MAEDIKKMPVGMGLPEMPEEIVIAPKKVVIDWNRIGFILLGLALFFLFYFMSELPDAVDPSGKHFPLPPQGRMAIGLFLMAAVWWIFEVMPIGATAIAISLPVSLVIAKYLGVAPEVIFFASLATAGMPFNLLIGAAPNAIAYESKQFTTGEFFLYRLDSQRRPHGRPGGVLLLHLAHDGHAGVGA